MDAPSSSYDYVDGTWVLDKNTFNASVFGQISSLEDTQARSLREAALSLPGAADRLTALNDKIVALRGTLVK
jgi:hypothetical protein